MNNNIFIMNKPFHIFVCHYTKLLDSLTINDIHKPGINWNHGLGYKLEVISVMDTIAICKLLEKDKPWATVKVGHKLIIRE